MSTPIFVVSDYRVKREHAEEFEEAVTSLGIVAKSRAENGCIFFNLLHKEEDEDEEEIDPDEPAIFGSVECWQNEESLENHNNSEHIKSLPAAVERFLVCPPTVTKRLQGQQHQDEQEDSDQ